MGPDTSGTFYSIARAQLTTSPRWLESPDLLFEIAFEFSNLKNEYTRKSYSFIDLIGEVGGVFEVFLLVLEVFFTPYYDFIFTINSLENMYKTNY